MEPLWQNERAALYCGDCLQVAPILPASAADLALVDPPYGLSKEPDIAEVLRHWLAGDPYEHVAKSGFLGKTWDSFVPGPEYWKGIYRALKPGGHLLCFSSCYDGETEVLTRNGWKRFQDVTMDDRFASLNLETNLVEWQFPKEIVQNPHPGPMIRYKTNKIDLLVTPNHKVLIANLGRARNFRLERADSHASAVRMKKDCAGREDVSLDDVFVLPPTSQLTSHGHVRLVEAKSIPLSAWLPFFGLWLAEGSSTIRRNRRSRGFEEGCGYNVSISHFDVDNLVEVQRLLSPYFDVHVYPEIGKLRINNKQLAEYLHQFGKAWQKFIPDEIKSVQPHYLKVLWAWYMKGDGSRNRVAYTSSRKLRDDLQELALYMGISADWVERYPKESCIKGRSIIARHPQYVVSFNHCQSQPQVYSKKHQTRTIVTESEWNGRPVYCVELERHHTLYVRRNGKAVWCGNTRTWDLMSLALRLAGFENRDTLSFEGPPALRWYQGEGVPKGSDLADDIAGLKTSARKNVPVFSEAQQESWRGWSTTLKPSWEVILVFRKPFPGTVAENALRWGAGAMHIDAARVTGGRFPANVILSHLEECRSGITEEDHGECAPGCPVAELDRQSGISQNSYRGPSERKRERYFQENDANYGAMIGKSKAPDKYGDKGGASRYFHVVEGEHGFCYCQKVKKGKQAGSEEDSEIHNNHPTVKPLKLLRYLIRLFCAQGGLVIDPFTGSASTGVAAIQEGCRFIGIDSDPDYCRIAVERLENICREGDADAGN